MGGASHGNAGGGFHGPSANGGHPSTASHGPMANGSRTTGNMSHGPGANGGPRATGGGMHPGGPAMGNRGRAEDMGNRGRAEGMGNRGGMPNHPSAFGGRPAPRGFNEHVARNGNVIRTGPHGHVRDIHDVHRGMDMHRGLAGGRRVSMMRADHSRVFAERGRRGFVERPYRYHGHDFARRSYYYHGHMYPRYYHGYYYRGAYMNVYAPAYYYHPAFYGWAYNPWAVPVVYGWGWAGNPWYGYYGYYFTPYPVYPSAAFWLTDYIISQDLQAAYAAHQEAQEADGAPPAGGGGGPALTPEVKQQIADEVRDQLALENQEAGQNAQQQDVDPNSSGIARMLGDGRPHVFVAGDSLDVVDASSGQECAISDGDALKLQTAPAPDATSANLVVLASKGGTECAQSSTVSVQLSDLQEMQNHMRESVDQGLQELQAKQGQSGLPKLPPSAQGAPANAQYASAAPPPDADVSAEIAQADQAGSQSEQEATAEAAQTSGPPIAANSEAPAPPAAPAGPPPSVDLGQTTDQVKAALGQPAREANLGSKVIYYYSNGMKVIFKNGKVSDVE